MSSSNARWCGTDDVRDDLGWTRTICNASVVVVDGHMDAHDDDDDLTMYPNDILSGEPFSVGWRRPKKMESTHCY